MEINQLLELLDWPMDRKVSPEILRDHLATLRAKAEEGARYKAAVEWLEQLVMRSRIHAEQGTVALEYRCAKLGECAVINQAIERAREAEHAPMHKGTGDGPLGG